MAIFSRGESNDPANPLLQLFIIDGHDDPIDAAYVGFRILDISTEQAKCHYANQDFNKIQVYPNRGPKYIDVNHLYTDTPAGHKLGTGNYYAPWTANPTLRVGDYMIIWEWKLGAGNPFRMTRQPFSVKEAE